MQRNRASIWMLRLCLALLLATVGPGRTARVTRGAGPGTPYPPEAPALPGAFQQASPALQMIGQVGGRTEDVAVQGGYAYAAVGLRLVVLDVSDPATPTEIGSTAPFPEFVEGVTVSGTLAYVADGMAGLRVIDTSEPTDPVEVGIYDTPGYAEGVGLVGQYAYVADGHYGLRIVDVSDPAHPQEVAYAYPLSYVFDVAVEGQHAYLAAAGAGLLVVDVSDPTLPVQEGSYDTPGYAYGIDAVAETAYVADGWEGLRLVDVSDPAHPVEVSSYHTPGWAFGVDVVETRAYVADAFAGLQVLDVSDPVHPDGLAGEELSHGHAGSVVVAGDRAYVADRNRGLRVLDVSDPRAIAPLGSYSPLGYAVAVAVSGTHAYVAAASYGLRVVDLSDPAHPVEVGGYATRGRAIAVAVDGDYAYVAVFGFGTKVETGLHVVDVSDPAHPTRAGYYGQVWASRDMAVADGMAYIADEWGLDVVDVSSPYSPTLVADVSLQGEEWKATSGIDVSGGLAYVVGAGGLYIVDVSNPVSPTLLSNLRDKYLYYVAATGGKAYVTGDEDCMTVIDAADPLHPAELGAHCQPYLPERVTVSDGIAYVGFGSGGVQGVNVADPSRPTLDLSYDTPGYAISSAVVSDTLYVADGEGGLLILSTGVSQSGTLDPLRRVAAASEALLAGTVPEQLPAYSLGGRVSTMHYTRHLAGSGAITSRHPRSAAQSALSSDRLAGTCVVASTADSGPGTLRSCMDGAISGDTITFDPAVFPAQDPVTITLQTGLPFISQGNLTIDASDAGVILDGSALADGSIIAIGSDENVIRGLQILNSPWAGVHICCGARYNVIGGNRLQGNGPAGEGNVISGNGVVGVSICDEGTMYNTVIGNLIGTDAGGTRALGNLFDGVDIYHGAAHNTIGSLIPGEGNLISGNQNAGVACGTERTRSNTIIGNLIGTDLSGTADLGNGVYGVLIETGSFHNTVRGNLISGNDWMAIGVHDPGTSYNTVVANLVGTDSSGVQPLGTGGVLVGGDYNRVGGTLPGDGNVINAGGIGLNGTHESLALGNLIGTNIGATEPMSSSDGIRVADESRHNFVGGTTGAERNVIGGDPVIARIRVEGTDLHFVLGNHVGADTTGTVPFVGGTTGVGLTGAKYIVIQGNLIAGSKEAGVSLGAGSSHNHLRANHIGVAADGVSALGNGMEGVSIWAASNTVGGPHAGDGNIIAFNSGAGVQVWTFPGNAIRRNSIYGNSGAGVFLADGGNDSLPAPSVIEAGGGSVSGTACPGCVVEIFSDEEDEGRVYEGHALADGNGEWVWTGSVHGPYVTATATDGAGNTSAFSVAQMALFERVYLPLLTRGSH